jgi:hypothetical protein
MEVRLQAVTQIDSGENELLPTLEADHSTLERSRAWVPHPCGVQGCGFSYLDSVFLPADSDPFFLRARRGAGRKPAPFTKPVKDAAPNLGSGQASPGA